MLANETTVHQSRFDLNYSYVGQTFRIVLISVNAVGKLNV